LTSQPRARRLSSPRNQQRTRGCSALTPGWCSISSNPDKTSDFEAVVAKLSDALQKSDKPERTQQAVSWKVFRAIEPGANGSVLYVFTIDPAVKGVDYTVSTILAEAFSSEVQALYKEYAEAYATGQNFVNLKLVSTLGH
jgi:hypothetical protein